MTHDHAAAIAKRAALLFSRLIREKKIKTEGDLAEASDIAIDLHNLSTHHQERHHLEPDPVPKAST